MHAQWARMRAERSEGLGEPKAPPTHCTCHADQGFPGGPWFKARRWWPLLHLITLICGAERHSKRRRLRRLIRKSRGAVYSFSGKGTPLTHIVRSHSISLDLTRSQGRAPLSGKGTPLRQRHPSQARQARHSATQGHCGTDQCRPMQAEADRQTEGGNGGGKREGNGTQAVARSATAEGGACADLEGI